VTGRRPHHGFAAPAALIIVEHPQIHDYVAQLRRAGRDAVPLDMAWLSVAPAKLPGLAAVEVLGHEHLDLLGKGGGSGH
jgi:hypothetical protein